MTIRRRAPFIVLEGLDRSGKSTQCDLLLKRIETYCRDEGKGKVKLMKFPDRTTPIGQIINSYLQRASSLSDHAIHLLFSANRWELAQAIEDTLNDGTAIICDRYAFSGLAFSASKVKEDEAFKPFGADWWNWLKSPDIGLPAPDLTLFLSLSADAAAMRGGYGGERYEDVDMQTRVRSIFTRIGEEVYQRGGRWVEINAAGELEHVSEDIWSNVKDLVEQGVDGDVAKLWIDRQ